jgi:RNA polymerase sigma factor (sigma-70 family)
MDVTCQDGALCPSDRSDADLLALVRQEGSRDAEAQLVARYLPRIRAGVRTFAHRTGVQGQEVDDLLQNALLTFLHVLRDAACGSCLEPYVKRCVENCCRNACRGKRRRQRREGLFTDVGQGEEDGLSAAARVRASPGEDPAASAVQRERAQQVGDAVRKLPLVEHSLLAWWTDDVPLQRIARCEGVSLRTVQRTLARLRVKLRADWGGKFA